MCNGIFQYLAFYKKEWDMSIVIIAKSQGNLIELSDNGIEVFGGVFADIEFKVMFEMVQEGRPAPWKSRRNYRISCIAEVKEQKEAEE